MFCSDSKAFTQEAKQDVDREGLKAKGYSGQDEGEPQFVGEFFDIKVSQENFFFIKNRLRMQ